MNNFQSVDRGGPLMTDFIHSSTVSMTENLKLFKFRNGDSGSRSSGGRRSICSSGGAGGRVDGGYGRWRER